MERTTFHFEAGCAKTNSAGGGVNGVAESPCMALTAHGWISHFRRGPAQFAHHSSLNNQQSAKAIIIAGIVPQHTYSSTHRRMKKKTGLHILCRVVCTMGVVDYLFAPRRDHQGWSTPSEAARIYFLLVILSSGLWAWPVTEGNILLWVGLSTLVSTPLLTLGWWIISLISQRYEPRVLVDSLNRIDRSKRKSIHSFRKP